MVKIAHSYGMMFNLTRMESNLTKLLVIAAGIGASASLMLYLFRKSKEEDYIIDAVRTSRQTVIKIRVPQSCVGTVIGKQGSTIKHIQTETNTKINFIEDDEDNHRVLTIRGKSKDAAEAEKRIRKIINDQPLIESYEMLIPQHCCGIIIGRNGDNIRFICNASEAKITLERSSFHQDKDALRRLTIRGTVDQIQVAKTLIEEKIMGAETKCHSREVNSSKNEGHSLLSITSDADETQLYKTERRLVEHLVPTASDGFMEVFISAVESPEHFWVQLIGTRATELDKMVEELTDHYHQSINCNLWELDELKVGDLVAAPFRHDDSWYRARVDYIEEESYSPLEKKITVFYVDFGDSGNLTMQDIYKLDARFLDFPFQAIECKLAKVLPSGSDWTEEAIQLFEQLTYVAQWIPVMARLDNSPDDKITQKCLELIDTGGTKEINVAEELVRQGFAIWED